MRCALAALVLAFWLCPGSARAQSKACVRSSDCTTSLPCRPCECRSALDDCARACAPAGQTACACEQGKCVSRRRNHLEGVVTRDGATAAGIQVGLYPCAARAFLGGTVVSRGAVGDLEHTTTDAQGHFAFATFEDSWHLVFAGDAHHSAAAMVAPAKHPATLHLEITPPGSLLVRVVDPGGAPVEGAVVRAVDVFADFGAAMRALFSASANALGGAAGRAGTRARGEATTAVSPGVFRTSKLSAEPWWLAVRAPGFIPVERGEPVKPAGERQVTVTLRPAAIVEGHVADTSGRPVAGAAVELQRIGEDRARGDLGPTSTETADEVLARIYHDTDALDGPAPARRTDAQGRFRFDEQPPGRYSVRVEEASHFSESRVVSAPANDLSFALYPMALVRVRVADRDGQPLSARVVATPSSRCHLEPAVRAAGLQGRPSLHLGEVQVGPLEACPHELRVECDAFVPATRTVDPTAGRVSELEVVLTR